MEMMGVEMTVGRRQESRRWLKTGNPGLIRDKAGSEMLKTELLSITLVFSSFKFRTLPASLISLAL